MPEQSTIERAREDKREGKAPSTQAGEFVREEMDHIREGKHGARSTKQAIAIGLSKARRAGVDVPPPKTGTKSKRTRSTKISHPGSIRRGKRPSVKRSKAITKALQREGHSAASHTALARQAKSQSRKRTAAEKSAIGRKAARTRLKNQTHADRVRIARKAARTRKANG